MDGVTAKDGELPINTSGGFKSKGHPLGASGVARRTRFTRSCGRSRRRQVEAQTGLACNVGGFGNCVTTTIMEAADDAGSRNVCERSRLVPHASAVS